MADRIWDGMTNQQLTDWYHGLDPESRQKLEAHLSKQELGELATRVVLTNVWRLSVPPERWYEEEGERK